MALLVQDEGTSFDLALRIAPSIKAVDLENVLHEFVAKYHGYKLHNHERPHGKNNFSPVSAFTTCAV